MDTTPQMREMAQVMELIDSPHDQEAIQRILRSLQYSTFDSPALQPQPLMSNQAAAAGATRPAAAGSAESDSVESLVAALTAGGNPYGQPIYAAMAQQFGPNWAQLGAPLLDDNQLLLAASAAAADVAARAKLGAEVLASRGGAAAAASAGVPASAAGGNSLLSGGPTPGLLTGHQLLLDDTKDIDPATMAEIDEDTVQITRMVIKIEPLHEETLRAIMVPWNEAVPEEQLTPSYLRSSVVDTIRYLAAVYLLTVADKYRCLPANDDRLELINNLMLSLWQGIGLLQPNVRDHIAQLLGVATPATADSICVAVTGLGIHSFFAALEPPVLERVCQELRLENCPPLRGAADPDALAPVYCDAIACHFYPTLRNQELGRCCFVRTTVHENGPGSFTCTVDTACLLSMMGLRSYVSNEFHCTSGGVKLPFRVKLQVNRVSKLSFFLCQRRVPSGVKAKLILRSASEAKARKAASLGGPNAVLFKESTGIVDSEMHFGFTDLISVADVLAADTARGGVGPRGLYNQNEDRLVFQFSLSFDPPAAHLLAEPPAAAAVAVADKDKKKQPQPAGKKASEPPKEAPKTKKEKQAEAAAAALALEEEEQRERRAREALKVQQLRQKRIQAFEKEEQSERDKFTQSQAASWGALCEEAKKSHQKELQRQRDRERKAELARMMPLVELQQQVQQLQQQVTQAKQALHKAQTEKNAMAKEATRAAAVLAEREAAVEQEEREIDEAEEELLRIDEELEKAEMELKARHEQEEVTRRQRSIDPLAQGAGGTARIDMTSFWFTSGSSPAAGNAPTNAGASNPAASLAALARVQPATTAHGSPGSGRARNAPAPAPPATQGVLQGLNGTPLSASAVAPPPFSATSSSPQPGGISATASGVTGPLLGPTLTSGSPLPNAPSFMPHARIPSSPAMQPPVHPPPHLHHQQQQHASHQTAAALLHQHHQLAPHLPHGIMGSAPPYQPPQHNFPSMRPPMSMLPADAMFGGPTQSTMAPPPSFASSGAPLHHPAPGAFGRGLSGFSGEAGLTGAFPPRWGPPAAPPAAGGTGALLQIASPLPATEPMLNGPGPAPSFMRGQMPAPSNATAGSTAAAGSGLELGVW